MNQIYQPNKLNQPYFYFNEKAQSIHVSRHAIGTREDLNGTLLQLIFNQKIRPERDESEGIYMLKVYNQLQQVTLFDWSSEPLEQRAAHLLVGLWRPSRTALLAFGCNRRNGRLEQVRLLDTHNCVHIANAIYPMSVPLNQPGRAL